MRTLFNLAELRESDRLPEKLLTYITEAAPIRGLGV